MQVPQFLLEDAILSGHGSSCHVIVTQPRRIAAISVAERVAAERGEKGGYKFDEGSFSYMHASKDALTT